MNFNGKIVEYEKHAAQAAKTLRGFAAAVVSRLDAIEFNTRQKDEQERITTYRATLNTFATGDPSGEILVPNTRTFIATIPSGQRWILKHAAVAITNQAPATTATGTTAALFLDGRIVLQVNYSTNALDIVLGPGILEGVSGADGRDFMAQFQVVIDKPIKVNDGFAGIEPNAGMMTGGRIDQERHFDDMRHEVGYSNALGN